MKELIEFFPAKNVEDLSKSSNVINSVKQIHDFKGHIDQYKNDGYRISNIDYERLTFSAEK